MRWEVREEPWVLPRVELDDVLRTRGAPEREMSDTRAVRASNTLAVEKDGKIRTILRPNDEHCEPLHGLAPKHDLHLGWVELVDALEPPQPQNLRRRWSFMAVRAVMLDPQSLPWFPIDIRPDQPVRAALSHEVSIHADVDPGKPDSGIGFGDENDGKWSRWARRRLAR